MFDGVSFLNKNATKESFLSNVRDFDIIHLSAHSFVDYQYPSNSAIIFSKKDSLTDNLLQIKDVDRLSLDGQLFTLSACNTFFGKKNEGEGLSSMARSFIQSGAGSVVGSFWSVPDEISKSFMIRFYSKLKEGMTKDEALQATKVDFMTDDNLSSPLYRSPVYWSAWVIYGDTQSIYKSNNGMMYLGIGLIFFSALLFIKYEFTPKTP
jgi:CHAT domain-containing protein